MNLSNEKKMYRQKNLKTHPLDIKIYPLKHIFETLTLQLLHIQVS